MPYTAKSHIQLLAETLLAYGVQDIVISPGSRNAPLTMHFNAHPKFNTYSIVDERSAGFVALGMAQKIQKPVAVCCTSGSATVNYYPALVEAFYQNIPLIVLSADRPTHFTDIFDGQTIRQSKVFTNHICDEIQWTEDDNEKSVAPLQLLLQKCLTKNGPVHINLPLDEPLYNTTQQLLFPQQKPLPYTVSSFEPNWDHLLEIGNRNKRIMILVGMQQPNPALENLLQNLSNYQNIIVLHETTSNIYVKNSIAKIDSCIFHFTEEEKSAFAPDLLITLGQNVISKKIKQLLRNHSPQHHWHVDPYWQPDTFFCLTESLPMHAEDFLITFTERLNSNLSDYQAKWLNKSNQLTKKQKDYVGSIPFCDLWAFDNLIQNFPKEAIIHYSNSSVIRYAQLFENQKQNPIFCNRGTSGIDGSTSTAVGFAMKSNAPVVLVTGDISFFYDSNALWNQYIPSNFRIILLNNGGGNIFKIIPGPSQTGVCESFFETHHQRNAAKYCEMYNWNYFKVNSKESIKAIWGKFYAPSNRPQLLEIDTQNIDNATYLKGFF